ncbi:hypothetical protein OT109_17070 [Phycisphaeraceae bacterium D3-23]
MPDYLPRQEGKRIAFAAQLAKHLLASPETYGVTPPEAEAFHTLYEQAAAAYRVSQTPAMRTAVTVRAKDEALAALVKETRRRVKLVRAFLITAEHAGDRTKRLAAIGLRPVNPSRARLRVPSAPPHLFLMPTMQGGLRLTVRDAAHPQRKAMPRGAMMVYVHVRIQPTGSGEWSAWRRWQVMGVTESEVTAPPWARPGDRVEVAVCFASPTCVRGPMSLPVSIVLGPVYSMRVGKRQAA